MNKYKKYLQKNTKIKLCTIHILYTSAIVKYNNNNNKYSEMNKYLQKIKVLCTVHIRDKRFREGDSSVIMNVILRSLSVIYSSV